MYTQILEHPLMSSPRRNASAEDKKEAAALEQQFANYRPSMLRNLGAGCMLPLRISTNAHAFSYV